MKQGIAIHWFRQDLRLQDNPALSLAAKHHTVLPIYILDDRNSAKNAMGAASRWWLHHSLSSLDKSLNGALSVYSGDPLDILLDLTSRYSIAAVYWNRCYEPWRMRRDAEIKTQLKQRGITVESTNGSLLWEPWNINKPDGTPHTVFTPFYRKGCLLASSPREPLPRPQNLHTQRDDSCSSTLDCLRLLPKVTWYQNFEHEWNVGEQGAHARFEQFLQQGLPHYKQGRNFPAKPYVSRLSPHLHFGEISPNQLWYHLAHMTRDKNIDHFCSELGWREFSYYQLYHHPELPTTNLQTKFDHYPWREDQALLECWHKGLTGVPMVDAGMRELWQTGYLHNRMRMIVASFLTKHLGIHWRFGERWFWDTLLDADLANNSASWQWVAGCGSDSAPYFRIFNPVTSGPKFDPDGEYVRKYVPELAALPLDYLFKPWEAPQELLAQASIELGVDYPKPVLDLVVAREAALKAFEALGD